MKFFKLDGTTQNSFSIGTGRERVELKTINGKLYYRNFGSGWIEVKDTTSDTLEAWQPNHVYPKGQLFTINNAVWYVKETHTSSSIFKGSINRVAKVAEYAGLNVFDVSLAPEFVIRSDESNKVIFEGSIDPLLVQNRKLILPDARNLERGNKIEIQNNSNATINVYFNDETTLFAEIKRKQYGLAILKNSPNQNGDWSFFNIGSGSGFLQQTDIKTVDYNADIGELVVIDTLALDAPFTVTLPLTPDNNDRVGFLDVGGWISERPVTINGNGKKIQNLNENWLLDANDIFIELVFNETLDSWFFLEAPIAGFSGTSNAGGGGNNSNELDITSNNFTVTHNLGYYPLIQILNSNLERIEGDIQHIDENIFQVTLSSVQSVKVIYK